MKLKHCLTLADAKHLAQAAREDASRRGVEAVIAVVDRAGDLMYLERPDDHKIGRAHV